MPPRVVSRTLQPMGPNSTPRSPWVRPSTRELAYKAVEECARGPSPTTPLRGGTHPRSRPVNPRISTCIHVYPRVSTCIHVYPRVSTCIHGASTVHPWATRPRRFAWLGGGGPGSARTELHRPLLIARSLLLPPCWLSVAVGCLPCARLAFWLLAGSRQRARTTKQTTTTRVPGRRGTAAGAAEE